MQQPLMSRIWHHQIVLSWQLAWGHWTKYFLSCRLQGDKSAKPIAEGQLMTTSSVEFSLQPVQLRFIIFLFFCEQQCLTILWFTCLTDWNAASGRTKRQALLQSGCNEEGSIKNLAIVASCWGPAGVHYQPWFVSTRVFVEHLRNQSEVLPFLILATSLMFLSLTYILGIQESQLLGRGHLQHISLKVLDHRECRKWDGSDLSFLMLIAATILPFLMDWFKIQT